MTKQNRVCFTSKVMFEAKVGQDDLSLDQLKGDAIAMKRAEILRPVQSNGRR